VGSSKQPGCILRTHIQVGEQAVRQGILGFISDSIATGASVQWGGAWSVCFCNCVIGNGLLHQKCGWAVHTNTHDVTVSS
jgi:hypothetical protein